jgi:hypothetical protein
LRDHPPDAGRDPAGAKWGLGPDFSRDTPEEEKVEALHLILMQAPSWTYRPSGRQDVSADTHLIPGGNHALSSLARTGRAAGWTGVGVGPLEERMSKRDRWMDWCRRGTAGRTDLLPSTYQMAPCRMEVELLMAIIVDIVSNVAPPLRSVIRSWQ